MYIKFKRLVRKLLGHKVPRHLISPATEASRRFAESFNRNLAECSWQPHAEYSVFTQYDFKYYTSLRKEYLHKYRCFHSVAKTISPTSIIELGTHAGSSADAYLGGAPKAGYLGIDQFVEGLKSAYTGGAWEPFNVAKALLESRGFSFRLMKANLRSLTTLPETAEMIVVDAAHDFENEYADLKLALTGNPEWIFVDDAADPKNAGPALARFLEHDLKGRVEFTFPVDYIDGGLVIKLKPKAEVSAE